MRETRIGSIEFTSDSVINNDPYVLALFGKEGTGKTRFPLTGPEPIGFVPLEMKAYATIDKDSQELDKVVYKPKDPMSLIVSERVVGVKSDVDKQKFYIEHVKKAKETIYALLEHRDTRIVVVDKFTTLCTWIEYAINGMTPKFVKIDGQVRQSKGEVRQSIIDFVNSLSVFKKPVVLNCASKADYDVVDSKGEPLRDTWDCGAFYMLGSHANLVCEMTDNVYYDAKKSGDKFSWKWALNVRRCQKRPGLEGPEGNPLLRDEEITLPQLIMAVEGEKFDAEAWL